MREQRVQVANRADRLLAGTAEFTGAPPVAVTFPFSGANLDAGTAPHWLAVASLETLEILLDAYRATGDEKYFDAAVSEFRAYSKYDRRALVPRGLVWNDHALANRMSILAELWLVLRSRTAFDAALAREVFATAARTAELLAKPHLFTFRTNHGVMQNLALLQYAVVFPTLDAGGGMGKLGCARLKMQLGYYVSPEGAILEHSAGYQEFGRDLLQTALRLSELGVCEPASYWSDRLVNVRRLSAMLRRPDGSQPVFGNTDHLLRVDPAKAQVADRPDRSFASYPVAGYAVWWTGLDSWPRSEALSQTVATWSLFPSRAHKHADDMSVVIWARGQPWVANAGYWPYETRGFAEAQGWRSSNAPHFVGEQARSPRSVRLRGTGDAGRVRALDVDRRLTPAGASDGASSGARSGTASGTASGAASAAASGAALATAAGAASRSESSIRRQVVALDGATWLVADAVDAPRDDPVERVWTLPAARNLAPSGDHAFLLEGAANSTSAARITFVGDLAGKPVVRSGSYEPFAGWAVRDAIPVAATSLDVRQPGSRSLLLSVLETGDSSELHRRAPPVLEPGSQAGAWRATVELPAGRTRIAWDDAALTVTFPGSAPLVVQLDADSVAAAAHRQRIVVAYEDASRQYPRFREITEYRYRVTLVALLLLVLQELTMLLARRLLPAHVPALRLAAAACWIAFGCYAAFWYLV